MKARVVKALHYAIVTALLLTPLACQESSALRSAAPREGNWISLFNGRDLTGWTPKFTGYPLGVNARNTFRVENGLLSVSYDNHREWNDLYGHLFFVTRPFSHYWIRAEYRFVGDQISGGPDWAWRNNGLMLHAQPPNTMTLAQEWPISVEMRLMGGSWLSTRPPTGSLCLIGTSAIVNGQRTDVRVTDSHASAYRGDQWVLAEAEVRGGKAVRYFINGEEVMTFSDIELSTPQPWSPQRELSSGYIAIQAESHPTQFRRIDVLPILP